MNIVYDLRYGSEHFPGIGTYANALLAALVELPSPDQFRVLWDPSASGTRFGGAARAWHPRVEWVETGAPALGWRAPIATGAVLRRLGGDVYLSPFYLCPVGAPMPVVLTLHDALHLTRESGSPPWLRLRFALALQFARGAAALLTVSEFARHDLVRRAWLPASKLYVVPNGVPPRFAGEPVRPAGVPDRPFAVVVGANRPHKNLVTLARAWRQLGEPPALELVAAGPIDARFPSLRQLAEGRGVCELGSVSAAELEWLYAHAVLLVFPSLYEGFGLPLLEAADRGLPVLASDIPALRETGGEAVRFVPPGDAAAWAAAVRELASDAAACERLRVAGRLRAAQFDYAVSAARARAVLASVVTGAAA
jgi:glycosyltransferase involved in cell wall biosynthesis